MTTFALPRTARRSVEPRPVPATRPPAPRGMMAALFGFALGMVGLVSLLAAQTGLPLETFTKDPATVGRMNPLSGLLTNLGVLGWTAAASVCVLTAGQLRTRRMHRPRSSWRAAR